MPGTDVAVNEEAGELEPLSAEEQALVAEAQSAIDTGKLKLPAIKLTNDMTQEVKDGTAEEGEWINSVTGESYGEEFEFTIGGMFNGRFYADQDGRGYPARGPIAPDNWPEKYAGKEFASLPDAEEQWRADTNAAIHEWGSGPPISNTHNFVGFVNGDVRLPVRLSLMRSSAPAAEKIKTIVALARAPWDKQIIVRARQASSGRYTFYKAEAAVGGVTPPELRQKAVDLAVALRDAGDNVELTGEESDGDAPKKRDRKPSERKGGLGIGDD